MIEIKPGLEISVRGLRWDAHWEFDCPVAIISPVFYSAEDGRSLKGLLEDLLIDACVDMQLKGEGQLKGHDLTFWEKGRGWSMAYLRRKYYRRGTERLDTRIRFILDEDGELSWEEINSLPSPT